uniref:RING-CH-type domain-containing protein n=1 Tax=Schistosoma mansoni TaxID=6183 RepID=A0A5K4FA14_SCHMA
MSEDQRITNRLTYPLSYLTNINEDTKGELVHSIIDFQQYHQKQEQSIHTCAVPINVCCVCSNESDPQLLHSNVQVLCATPGCKYSGPIHRKCLEHWDACCDFYCHLLNNSFNNSLLQTSSTFDTTSTIKPNVSSPSSPSSSTSILSNFNDSPLHKSFMEGLFRLYECPACNQYTLYRSSIHSTVTSTSNVTGQTPQTLSSTPSNHFTSVLCAIQYATEKLNQSENPLQSTLLQSDPFSQCKQYTSNSPVDCIGSMELLPNFLDDLKSQSKMPITNSSTTVRSHSYVQPPLITDRFSDILRRFSLSRDTNDPTKFSTSNTSSSMSSGYHSGLSTGEHTVDPSRRCSDNSYDQFMFSMKGDDLMKANEENSIPWGMTNIQTGQSIPRALIKGATINNPIKLPNDAAVLNDVTKYSIDSSTPTTRKSYSSTVNLDDLFDRSLDTTVNNNTTNNNDNNNSIGNINLMNRPLSAIGSRRHHSTSDGTGNISSSTIGCTTNTTTTTTSTTNTNTAYHHNVKSNTTWSNDSISKSRMTHWHGNNNVETKMKKVVNTKGNIFLQRHDFNVFMNLPNHKQNAYFIQMDDDSCTGNEDTRAFLLAQLTNHRVSEVYCLACQEILPIYDHFPVIDGIFFISPLCHRSNEGHRKGGGLRVTWHTNGIQNQSVQQQQQQTHRAHNTTTTNNNDNSSIGNHLVSSTNDYQSINEIALKLLAPLKIISPPPGCLGPRQQLNSTQHNMINTGALGGGGSSQGAGSNNSNNSIPSRFSTNHSSTRQCRYLHALCMNCMHSVNLVATSQVNDFKGIRCKICSKPWSGTSLLVGGLYTYDIFAAVPCCSAHLTCGSCQSRLDNLSISSNSTLSPPQPQPPPPTNTLQLSLNDLPHQHQYHDPDQLSMNNDLKIKSYPLNYFSQYSNLIICPYCSKVDYHFVKLFEDFYEIL